MVNKGFSSDSNRWQEAEGKAYFVEDEHTGHLKVSFFGPFYGSYIIFELDSNYQHVFVTSYNKSYLWLLSRKPTVDEKLKEQFIKKAKILGFNVSQLIFVNHE